MFNPLIYGLLILSKDEQRYPLVDDPRESFTLLLTQVDFHKRSLLYVRRTLGPWSGV